MIDHGIGNIVQIDCRHVTLPLSFLSTGYC